MTTGTKEEIAAIKAAYPDVNWDRFENIDRALNWELWHGTLPSDYWTDVEPLEHYVWKGFERAQNDLREVLEGLPSQVWMDKDCEPFCVTETDPNEDPDNWEIDPDDEDCAFWIGGDNWCQVDPREIVMHHESWKQVF